MELHERDVFRRTDYRRAAYEDESSREREPRVDEVTRRRRKMTILKRRGWQTRDYPGGKGGSARKCERTFGRDASRGRIKCNDVTLLFFFSFSRTCHVYGVLSLSLHRLSGTCTADNRRRKRRSKGKELCNNNTRLSAGSRVLSLRTEKMNALLCVYKHEFYSLVKRRDDEIEAVVRSTD